MKLFGINFNDVKKIFNDIRIPCFVYLENYKYKIILKYFLEIKITLLYIIFELEIYDSKI